MREPSLIARQRALLRDLIQRSGERARAEPAIAATFAEQVDNVEIEFSEGRESITRRLTREQEDNEREVEQKRIAIEARYKVEQDAANREFTLSSGKVLEREQSEKEAAQTTYQEACWTIAAVLEGAKNTAEEERRENQTRLNTRLEDLHETQQKARALLEEWKQPAKEIEAEIRTSSFADKNAPPPKLSECVVEAHQLLEELQRLTVPRFYKGRRLALLIGFVWLASILPLGYLAGILSQRTSAAWILMLGLIASSLTVLLVAPLLNLFLSAVARKQIRGIYDPLCQIVVDADSTRQLLLDRYESEFRQRVQEAKKKHNEEVLRANALYKQQRAATKRRVAQDLPPLEERHHRLLQESEQRRADDLRQADELYEQRRTEIQQCHDEDMRQLHARREQLLQEIDERHETDWSTLVEDWRQAMARLRATVAEVNDTTHRLLPNWDDPSWQQWQPPVTVPPVLRLGHYHVRMDQVPKAIPSDAELREMTPAEFDLPALCDFPARSSLLLQASDAGRTAAVQTLQAIVFRLLTALPAGKVRFVIVDPVGLGQNFAAFMHLADYDEQLVASRIWTETPHIEQRLADLTLHMENVIQKYLRNQYETIADYNIQAGEVAEPFRVLVVANFPVNFSPEAIRRLLSIMQSGPRCGVFTLVSVDSKVPLPKGFDIADLEANSLNCSWDGQRFRWKDADFAPYPLTLDAPPETEFANRILARIGEAAQNAQRVEVPFEFIAPAEPEWWRADSRRGLRVALGRAGATQRQSLDLGKGTAQHALIAGKTGSGKSTLLHALITNLALQYSPDEVELYLIDFKKGVEFKTYAVHDLPHARVIAIESEREFGLSVLQRLDAELRLRGERFRDARAQDLNAYRQAAPAARMPRVLLIVDEFQEFFTEDDRIAQEAAQLLDRLVRQGRAFGMHVLLGSQTLGGAYTLARSTIDQMAVRIALQCSEADAHLILSDDNSAARLLSRPGEAIYNDANGLVEGNNPFQVVWLGDDRREQYLTRIRDLTRRHPPMLQEAPVVFEGNAPADVSRNHLLNERLRQPVTEEGAESRQGQLAWLGEAMAINDLTAAPFRRHHGSNLLLVGQQEEMSLGMLTTAVVSLAAQMTPSDATRFYLVDGRQAQAPTERPLARLPDVLPQTIRLAGWRDVPAIVAELNAEIERRQKESAQAPSIYLVLFGVQRLRDLRRQEDDFSFMRKGDDAPNPAQQFATLLREGSVLGIHTLMWCDTLNNLQRTLDRQSMRELTMRVLFQMNVSDSSNLIDSPLASKLGLHRALFFNEEDGRLDKFRPYGLPSEAWLARVQEQLARRADARESVMLP
ncbi:MAG TPA: FtsK/SpoIIIE domain-containing protein [Gemmataceae bacterium]|jgi:energy-coupling factor transporter ATP-binding protein EcfA2